LSVRKRKFKIGTKYFVDKTLPDGTRVRKILPSREKAELVDRKIDTQIFEGTWNVREIELLSFRKLAEKYLEYAKNNKSASTFSADRCRINKHLLKHFKDTLLTHISVEMVEAYKSKRIRDGASAKTINLELSNLQHMMKKAKGWRHVRENVVEGVEKMRLVKNNPRYLTQDEIDCLLDAAKGYYIYPILVTAIHTGMRKSEMFNLTWDDVDFDEGITTVQSKNGWHTKNYESRDIPLTPRLRRVLLAHKRDQEAQGVNISYVFTYEGRKLHATIKKNFRRVLKKAGLKNVTLHSLRHIYASQLVMAGASLRDVQELMGHASFETTTRYTHLERDHLKEQVMKLPFAD